jgi:hypothetical protein
MKDSSRVSLRIQSRNQDSDIASPRESAGLYTAVVRQSRILESEESLETEYWSSAWVAGGNWFLGIEDPMAEDWDPQVRPRNPLIRPKHIDK